MSPKHQRVLTDLCLQVLHEAVGRPGHTEGQMAAVRLALRCLMPSCPDRALLTRYWTALTAEVDIGRDHGLSLAFEAVRIAVGPQRP